jgi:hypothetical protein
MSEGLVRGTLVKTNKYGVVYIGGAANGKVSVHDIKNGKRLAQNVRVNNCKFLSYNKLRT